MKIAIHHRPGSFSDRWIEYCKNNNIDFKIVNAYAPDIIEQVKGCNAFMWHHHHGDYRDALFAKQLIYSLEESGVKCFPNFHTTWHFDDKVGQKYLLEAVGAPLVPSYVFYTKNEALEWISKTSFPKVFKLRGGAGASNVKLAHNAKEARKFVKKAFGEGYPQYDGLGSLKERYRKWRIGQDSFVGVLKGVGRMFIKTDFAKMHHREKGYVYFQDFIRNNYYDIRVIVIGERAFYIKRIVREGDFRASGSGNIVYEKDVFTEKCVQEAFEINKKIESQCTAFDFVIHNEKPMMVEISYGFAMQAYDKCEGYYDRNMQFHHEIFNPQEWMIDNLCRTQIGGGKSEIINSNCFDLRIVVIGDKLMAERRMSREGDFRASGSGLFEYVKVDEDIQRIAFETAEKLQLQSVAFDFIFDNNKPLIIEMSYAFGTKGISHCPGYYTRDYRWHEALNVDFCGWMVEDLIK